MGSKNHRRHEDSDDYERRHSKKSKSSSRSESSSALPSTIQPITEEDYYEKASEFRLWLKEKRKKYFDELDRKDAQYYFKKFVKAWNRYELNEQYYKGINSAHISSSDTTAYKWSFAKNVNSDELAYIKDKVDSMTGRGASGTKPPAPAPAPASASRRRANVGPSLPSSASSSSSRKPDQVDWEEQKEKDRLDRKAEYRAQKRRTNDYINDTVPKLEGREAKLAEKRATNAMRRRERSPDVELNDHDIYGGGGGDDDYKTRLAIEKRNNERRQARYEERKEQRLAPIKDKLADYKAKENETMAYFRKMAQEQRERGGL